MLKVENLVCAYKGRGKVLEGVSFEVPDNRIAVLLGHNGTGKTTLLKGILGLLPIESGSVTWKGWDLLKLSPRERAANAAYVPQITGLVFPYSVLDVVMMGRMAHLKTGSSPKKEDFEICEEALWLLGIERLAGRNFQTLSGGEKQLVLISRALAQKTSLIILDEPTASLDFANTAKILSLIKKLQATGLTVLFSTHDPDHAFAAADTAVMIKGGKVFASGSPEEVITSESLEALYGIPGEVAEVRFKDPSRPPAKVCIAVPD